MKFISDYAGNELLLVACAFLDIVLIGNALRVMGVCS